MDENKYEVFWYYTLNIFQNFQFVIIPEAI